jgi:hypothetical protein
MTGRCETVTTGSYPWGGIFVVSDDGIPAPIRWRGTGASDTWLNIHSHQGPFYVAADDCHVYWDWGGVAGSPMHIGTAQVDRAGFRASILTGQGAFLLTSPGANS